MVKDDNPASLASRERIVGAAMALFQQRGYTAVGVQDICQIASSSKSSFYHHFASKEALALAVIEARWSGLQVMLEPLHAAPLPPLVKLQRFFDSFYGMACATRQSHGLVFGCPFGSLGSELSSTSEPVRQRVVDVFDRLAALFEAWLQQARAEGALDPASDTSAMAQDLLAVMQGISLVGRIHNAPEALRDSGARLLNAILMQPIPGRAAACESPAA